MTKKDASVSEEQTGEVAATATQASGDGVVKTTPAQSSGDGEAKFVELQRTLEKYQKDLNSLKSASQKREADLGRQLQQQRDSYEQKLVALMDDDARSEYEKSTRDSRLRELQEQAEQAQAALQRQNTASQVLDTFMERGVPVDVLMKGFSDGPEGIAGVAWEWLFDKANNSTPSQKSQQTSSSETQSDDTDASIKAPKVVTETAGTPYSGPTWDDLVEKHGSEDNVFTLVENGILPKEVVPEYREAKAKSQ